MFKISCLEHLPDGESLSDSTGWLTKNQTWVSNIGWRLKYVLIIIMLHYEALVSNVESILLSVVDPAHMSPASMVDAHLALKLALNSSSRQQYVNILTHGSQVLFETWWIVCIRGWELIINFTKVSADWQIILFHHIAILPNKVWAGAEILNVKPPAGCEDTGLLYCSWSKHISKWMIELKNLCTLHKHLMKPKKYFWLSGNLS